jgi:polyisoprenyl-phosphate glycosyltransferase
MEINNKEQKLISVVIYLHNNEDKIVGFVKNVIEKVDEIFEKFEVIIVNDCSYDRSVGNLKNDKTLSQYTISILNMSIHQGLEISMSAGIDISMGDFVYEFDDLNVDYDFSLIRASYNKIISGFDIVSVSPKTANTFFSRLFYKVFNRYSKSRHKLRSDRFRILSRRAINRAYSISKSVPYRKALYANSGLNLEVIEYIPSGKMVNEKVKGVFRNRMAINALIIYTNLAFNISIGITLALFLFTVLTVFYVCFIYFSGDKPIEGWTTTMLLMSGSFSGIFFILAIIIKYLSLIIELVYSKKTYLVESVERL